MAIKASDIKVRAWVYIDGVKTDVYTLDPVSRQRLATKLSKTLLNTIYAGRAVFEEADYPSGPAGHLP